ncbi:MAG: hypothetical protein ACXQTD_00100 [Candidatus Syntropharchaeia archaeon]
MKVTCRHCGYSWDTKTKYSWVVCSKCGKGTKFRDTTDVEREYWKKYNATKGKENNRRWYQKNREKILAKQRRNPKRLAYLKEYRQRNIDRLRAYDRERNKLPHRREKDKKRHAVLNRIWHNGVEVDRKVWKKAEKIALEILKQEGFAEVERTNFYFPFDYWGKFDGDFAAIEVTCTYKRQKKDIVKRFLAFTGWRYFVLFITPDLSRYVLKECKKEQCSVRALTSRTEKSLIEEFSRLKEIRR